MPSKKKRPAAGVKARSTLHAPWRIEFILAPKPPGCFFCEAAQLDAKDRAAWKRTLLLYRDPRALIIMNRYPYIGGHLLIAPHRHTAALPKLDAAESHSLWELSRRCIGILERVMKPQGFNYGMNLGRAGGAGVEEHLHMHVLPRWAGDTNFMPVIAHTGTVPVALEALWEELFAAIEAEKASWK